MSKDMPMARNILQRSKLQEQKKGQKEGFARNFFWLLGVLAAVALSLITGMPRVVEWSLWSVVGNIAGMIVLSFGLGLLFALMFNRFYQKLAAIDECQLNSLELAVLGQELENHPDCLELLQEERGRFGAIKLTRAAQAMIEAGVFKP